MSKEEKKIEKLYKTKYKKLVKVLRKKLSVEKYYIGYLNSEGGMMGYALYLRSNNLSQEEFDLLKEVIE